MEDDDLNQSNHNNSNDNNNDNESEEDDTLSDDFDDNNFIIKRNILLCPHQQCKKIPEIYFDEKNSSIYLNCGDLNKKHKYNMSIKNFLRKNSEITPYKLKDEEEKELQHKNNPLNDEANQEIEDMKNKIILQKKFLENLVKIFNTLIQKLANDFTALIENRLSILLLQKKIIYTYLKYSTEKNAIKNFQNLTNFIQNLPIPNNTNNDENNAYMKNIITSDVTNLKDNNNQINNENKNPDTKTINERLKSLGKIFKYFVDTSHNLMTQNKTKNILGLSKINNLKVLNSGNLCFSSETGVVSIFSYNKQNSKFDLINSFIPLKNNWINYLTQLSNDLLVCNSKKLIIGKLSNNDKKYDTIQIINEFEDSHLVKTIELSNNYLVTYDRSLQISIFKPFTINTDDTIEIQYQLLYNKINKGEMVYSLLSLPEIIKKNNNKERDIQYISTSNNYSSYGNSCIRFYSSLVNYNNFDTIYNINCSRFVDSVSMLNEKILCVGVQSSHYKCNIALVDIITREIVTWFEDEYCTSIYKLKNDLVAVGVNKLWRDDNEIVPFKRINFYVFDGRNELIYINSINSNMKNFVCSFGEMNNIGELICVNNDSINIFQ